MSRSDSKAITISNNIDAPLMKVNQIINSIFALSQATLLDQVQTCSKIVSQLLQNQLINHIASITAAKLLCYELILLIAQQNAVDSRPRLSLMENVFGNNKKIKLTASLRNTLTSLEEVLEEMIWKNGQKKRGNTQKKIVQNSPLYQGYVEFKHLLQDFDNHFAEDQQQNNDQNYNSSINKKTVQKDQSDSEQNQALIQQLQQIISKKQRRIKQLNQQLQQNILQQKAQQDLITQLQSRNIQLKQQLRLLNLKLTQKDQNQINLQQYIQNLKAQNLLQQKQLYSKKTTLKTEKTIKTRFTIDDDQQPSNKKEYKQLFDDKPHVCSLCQQKKDISIEDVNNFRRLLLTQAMSIQALI